MKNVFDKISIGSLRLQDRCLCEFWLHFAFQRRQPWAAASQLNLLGLRVELDNQFVSGQNRWPVAYRDAMTRGLQIRDDPWLTETRWPVAYRDAMTSGLQRRGDPWLTETRWPVAYRDAMTRGLQRRDDLWLTETRWPVAYRDAMTRGLQRRGDPWLTETRWPMAYRDAVTRGLHRRNDLWLTQTQWPVALLLLLLLKPAALAQVGKTKLFKLLSQPHKHLSHGKLKKTQLREAANCWLHPWTHPTFRCQTQRMEGHTAFEPEPAGNT